MAQSSMAPTPGAVVHKTDKNGNTTPLQALAHTTYQSAPTVPPGGVGANADGVLSRDVGGDGEASLGCVVP